jgi:hypothetical protein
VDGNDPTVSQAESDETEFTASEPPPEFTMLKVEPSGCGFEAIDANEISDVLMVSCGGGAVTVSDTVTVCDLPAQICDVQAITTLPEYGDPADVNASAALFRPIETVPGVVDAPVAVSHGTEGLEENVMLCETMLDATEIAAGEGAEEVPAVIANEALLLESTISGDAGRMVIDTPSNPVAGVAAESVTVMVKPASPAVVGVPPICPELSESPSGRFPRMPNVYGGTPPLAVRICGGYDSPTKPDGKVAPLVIVSGAGLTTIETLPTADPFTSCTRTPTVYEPGVVGMPLMVPEELKLRPSGSTPPLCDQVNGAVPPEALSEAE